MVKEPKGLIMNFWQIKDYLVKNLNKNIIKRKEKEKNTTLLSIVKNFVSGYKGPRISLRFQPKQSFFPLYFLGLILKIY